MAKKAPIAYEPHFEEFYNLVLSTYTFAMGVEVTDEGKPDIWIERMKGVCVTMKALTKMGTLPGCVAEGLHEDAEEAMRSVNARLPQLSKLSDAQSSLTFFLQNMVSDLQG